MKKRKATFVGCVKNSADALPEVLKNIERLANEFSEVAYIFVENDSNDETLPIIRKWGEDRQQFTIHSLTGLDQIIRQRTLRLETCRNLYLTALKSTVPVCPEDVVIMMDMDNVNAEPIDLAGFRSALRYLDKKSDLAAVTATQAGAYYDLWALRHPQFFNKDIWEDVLDVALAKNLVDQAAFDEVMATCDTSFISRNRPTEVDSAFGGLGVYKFEALQRNPLSYCGQHTKFLLAGSANFFRMQRCEHVNFHIGFKLLGKKVEIHPDLINPGYGPVLRLNPSVFRTLTF
jgi:glycosyltransferase involved in cell wall biosynthesis